MTYFLTDTDSVLLFLEPQNHPHMFSQAEEVVLDKIKRCIKKFARKTIFEAVTFDILI